MVLLKTVTKTTLLCPFYIVWYVFQEAIISLFDEVYDCPPTL
jgi:hypothetical protein